MAKKQRLNMRVSEEEKNNWTKKAQDAGLSLSELVRQLLEQGAIIQNKQTTSEADWERLRHLARIGNNLNQLARWANSYKEAADAVQVILTIREFKRSLDAY